MIKIFVYSILFLYSFLFQTFLGALPLENEGTLYFPVAWKVHESSALKPGQFSDAKITLRNTKTKINIEYTFDKVVSLNQDVVFLGKKTLTVPSGNYDSIYFSAFYINQQNGNRIEFDYTYPINFNIVNGKTTILGGVLARSTIDNKLKNSKQVSLIKVNRFSMDYADIQDGTNLSKDIINFSNTTSPLLVQEVSSKQNASKNLARYGFLLNTPCAFNGVTEINFKYNNDPLYYFKAIQVKPKQCSNLEQHQNPVNIYLPTGTWNVQNVSQASMNELKTFGFSEINNPLLMSYYKTDTVKFLRNNAYAKKINRRLSINVQKDYSTKPFLYIGIFESKLNKSNEIFTSVTFNRDFALRDIRKLFGQNQVYNGYTGERIVRDKLLGSLYVLVRKIDVSHAKKEDVQTFQNALVKHISVCLKNAEAYNPLLDINGSILINNSSSAFSLTPSEMKFVEKSPTVDSFKKCLVSEVSAKNLPRINEAFTLDAEIYSL